MELEVGDQKSEVGGEKTDDRRQKRAELVEEWSIISDFGLVKKV